MNNRKTIATLLVLILLMIPFLLRGQAINLVDEIAGRVFDKILDITIVDRAIELLTLNGEVSYQAYLDLIELRDAAHRQWITHNKAVNKYEADLAMAENALSSAESEKSEACKAYKEAKKALSNHLETCLICEHYDVSYMCYDATMYRRGVADAYTAQQNAEHALSAAKGKVKVLKDQLSTAKRARKKMSNHMDIYSSAAINLYVREVGPYLREREEKKAEARILVHEVINESPGVISDMQAEIERLKQSDEDKSAEIKSLNDAIQNLQSEVESLNQRLD